MPVTRAVLMANARDVGQMTGSSQWSDAIVRTWLGLEHRAAYRRILNANNEYRMAQVVVTEDVNGQFVKTLMDTGTGDTAMTHYRILSLSDSQQMFYRQTRYQDFPNPTNPALLAYVWYEFGLSIQVFPAVSGNTLTATVNAMPVRADLLASDASLVDFPDDYESALAWGTAAYLAKKGGNETDASREYRAVADAIYEDMLNDIRRAGKDPTRMRAMDDPAQWGSV
jgi:hypothetical protein